MNLPALELPQVARDGHRYSLLVRAPAKPMAQLLWLPALGVAARHYLPLAEALAVRGIAVYLHEMRGNGSSSLRAGRRQDWGYREILTQDLACSQAAMVERGNDLPAFIGGHSIGAQLACCYLGLHPQDFTQLWLVAGGTPYWRTFPAPKRYLFPLAYQFAPWLADWRGSLPGRRLGFGGEEARTLMRDWAAVGLSNRYAAIGLDQDLEAGMAQVEVQARGVLLNEDWFAPRTSMQALLDKFPGSATRLVTLDRATLGVAADHFAWMKRPDAVADALLDEPQPAA